ncbi:MAG: thioredoxin domain-containing protein [Flavobacteriales bacterium]
MSSEKKANHLSAESSPYLRQHMHNPVEWYAWGDDAWQRAQKENKLVLISIGYSACHWCHVMEHQSFENEKLASIMNEHFINIKVDREERPDIDHIYMDAVQLMTGRGGWPLNCFALPDKRPVYGGTYFPPEQWEQILLSLADVYKNQPEKVFEYAEKLTNGIKESELNVLPEGKISKLTTEPKRASEVWKAYFDNEFGGPRKAPKFPLPCNYIFLLRYGHLYKDAEILAHVKFTLNQMANGGIYDHVGGGFARYSVDAEWHVPHFEKMLYDNAQLISLYSEAFAKWKEPLYKKVVEQTVEFVNRELRSPEGAFYSALDADTNGEEGDFYVWKEEELRHILTENEYALFSEKFGINSYSLWEHEKNVLRVRGNVPVNENSIQQALNKLFSEREKRTRPGLDNKILTSWNALMITALCKAGIHLKKDEYINQARLAFAALKKQNTDGSGNWHHCRQSGSRMVNAFADDMALLIEAVLGLYEATFDEIYVHEAKKMYDDGANRFYDAENHLFFYTAANATDVLVRKYETYDNVIPASNSVWAMVSFKLGSLLGNAELLNRARAMVLRMSPRTIQNPMAGGQWLSNQLDLLMQREVAITGTNALDRVRELRENYLPDVVWAVSISGKESLALLESRLISGQTLIYVCRNNTCNLPVESVNEALKALEADR